MTAYSPRSAARAIDALRRGWVVRIHGDGGTFVDVTSVEMLGVGAALPDLPMTVIISGERAATLKLSNQLAAASPGPVAVAGVGSLSCAMALADPALDMATPMKGPFRTVALPDDGAARAAIDLCRHAGLLPALALCALSAPDAETSASAIGDLVDPAHLQLAARARLPVSACENAEILAFRSPDDMREHVALLLGTPDGSPPVVILDNILEIRVVHRAKSREAQSSFMLD